MCFFFLMFFKLVVYNFGNYCDEQCYVNDDVYDEFCERVVVLVFVVFIIVMFIGKFVIFVDVECFFGKYFCNV